MAMTAGVVSINTSTGAVTASGFAGDRYNAMWAEYVADLVAFGQSPPADVPTLVKIRQGLAKAANGQAAVITYIQTNAETSSDAETIL